MQGILKWQTDFFFSFFFGGGQDWWDLFITHTHTCTHTTYTHLDIILALWRFSFLQGFSLGIIRLTNNLKDLIFIKQQLCDKTLAYCKSLIKEPLFMMGFIDTIPNFNRSGIYTSWSIIYGSTRRPWKLETTHISGFMGVFKKIDISLQRRW